VNVLTFAHSRSRSGFALGDLELRAFLYSAQRKRRNGENIRTLTLTLSLTLILTLTLTLTLFPTLNLTLNDYFRCCTICVAPNTDTVAKLRKTSESELHVSPGALLYPVHPPISFKRHLNV